MKHQRRRKGREIFLHPLMEPSTMAFEQRDGVAGQDRMLFSAFCEAEGKRHYRGKTLRRTMDIQAIKDDHLINPMCRTDRLKGK